MRSIATRAMRERGLLPDFSGAVSVELATLQTSASAGETVVAKASGIRDLTGALWASIDNDDSRDLDQLTVAETASGDAVRILVAVADVDALVKAGSAIDQHARHNTTSVYTAAEIFPMLPEQLSTNLTSLNADEERLAVVVDMVVGGDGTVQGSEIYRAQVRNKAKLAYNSVAAWLDESGAPPQAMSAVAGLADNLRLQDRVAARLRDLRHAQGALSLETIQSKPQFEGDQLRQLAIERPNRAKQMIENFMIA
ncbi:MAG TPA: RNB domain-containing ribonuclease, partial [Vicinamibacterales bacterium]